MAITLRLVTGSVLTYGQVDTNFSSLFYSASQSGNSLVLHTTGSTLISKPPTTTAFNLGLGNNTTTPGQYSHAEGYATTASGSYSHAEGGLTTASGSFSHAEGDQTLASGYGSHTEGVHTTASGYYTHAEGISTTASGDYSHAEGYSTNAAFYGSHTEGSFTRTTNYYAHAEGNGTVASGNSSHAEGNGTTASGDYSHAEALGTKALGRWSHAEGEYTIASGTGSHAEGQRTVATGDYQHVQGQYNISSPFQSAFILGNGTSDGSRSNLIFASGSEVQISGSLTVGSGSSTVAPTWGVKPTLAIGMPTGSTGGVLDLRNTNSSISPGDILGTIQFSGGASTAYASSQIKATVYTSPGSGNPGGGILSFWTGPATYSSPLERMRINNIGNVGIGTTDPTARLTLGLNDFMMVSTDFGGKAGILFSEAGAKTPTDVQYGAKIFYDEANDLLQLSTRQNNVDKLGIVITRADGNVGIGKTDPQSKLDVSGSTIITGSLIVTSGITGSFKGDGSQITGVTAEWDGSHNGNATITGSLTVSSNATIRESIFAGAYPPVGTSGGYFNILNTNGPSYSSFAFLGIDDNDNDAFGTVAISANPEDGVSLYGSAYNNTEISRINVIKNVITIGTPSLNITTAATSISASNSVKLISPSVQVTGSLSVTNNANIRGNIFAGAFPLVGASGGYLQTVNDSNNSQFVFYSKDDTDHDNFGNVTISANAEEGIYLNASAINGSNSSTVEISQGQLLMTNSLLQITSATASLYSSNYFKIISPSVQITGSLITSGTLLVGGTIVPGTPTFGSTPDVVVGKSTGGVLDIRNTNGSISPGDILGIIQFSGKDDATVGYASSQIKATAYTSPGSGNPGGGILSFWTSLNSTGASPVERMRINNDGKVGIGTTDPEARIHSVTSVSGPVSYGVRAAVYGENTSTDTSYANSIGVAGKVSTTGGMAIYGDATTGGGWAGYFNGKLNVNGNATITGSLSNGIHTSASGNYSHAEGTGSIAAGEYSHAEGYLTNAEFYGSHAEGAVTRTTNYYAHAEGFSTLASGNSSHAEGHSVTASGDYSHAEGFVTKAIGPWSHTEGTNTVAFETGSHAEGFYTVASGSYQHVQGQFNISSSAQSAFIHGNGTSDGSRSNLIYAAGNTVEITGSLMLNDILVLAPRTTTPAPLVGMVIVSGSGVDQHIYCYLNSTWKQLD